jgi:hypothetical protein
MTPSTQAQTLVQAQLDAFNCHDVDALLGIYAADAALFQHPDVLLAQGAEQIGARLRARFAGARPQARLLHRIAIGKHVIDQEVVDAWSEDGWSSTELVANYEVRDGRIARAWFIGGAVTSLRPARRLLEHCKLQAGAAGFHALELAGTMPGVPLYLACGFAMVEEFEIALPGDVRVPLARMRKAIAPHATGA